MASTETPVQIASQSVIEDMDDTRQVFTSEDVASLLGVCIQTARALMRRNEIPGSVRIGKRYYVSRKSLLTYLNLCKEV